MVKAIKLVRAETYNGAPIHKVVWSFHHMV